MLLNEYAETVAHLVIKVVATKPNDLNSIIGTDIVEGENH